MGRATISPDGTAISSSPFAPGPRRGSLRTACPRVAPRLERAFTTQTGTRAMPLNKDTIGVGFIGAGDISILHAAAVRKCPGVKLVGLWNRDQTRAKNRAADFGCTNFATPEALVADPNIDAV